MKDNLKQPIIACSTGNAPSAIAVLRLSGEFQVTDFKRIIKLKQSVTGSIEPLKVYRVGVYRDDTLLDDALLTYFKGPKSYTGEDIIELSVHGNPLNTQRIIDTFVEFYQFSPAKGGEFTLRALKNKKISLSQVEGLDLMLNATSLYAYDSGLSLLDGETHQLYLKLHELLLKHRSALELLSDFAEDVGADVAVKLLQSTFDSFLEVFKPLSQRVIHDASSLLNPHIVIYGSPNAGKSTFFNNF
jgi:tRNA modification GTPase